MHALQEGLPQCEMDMPMWENWFMCCVHKRTNKRVVTSEATVAKVRKTDMDRLAGTTTVPTHQQLLEEDIAQEQRRATKRIASNTQMDPIPAPGALLKRIRFGPTIAKRFGLHDRCRGSSSSSLA